VISAEPSINSDLIRRAFAHTAGIARHYENFTVVSFLLPRALKQHFYNVYAFCRHSDDLADEISDTAESLSRLDRLKRGVEAMYVTQPSVDDDESGTLILTALQQTVRRFDIPADPFLKLIDAFEQDRRVTRYHSFEQLRDYCRRSADPVGHLVLYLCGYRDAQRQELSDFTCTALQLANFWQDVANDVDRGRIYIPLEDMRRFGVTETDILHKRFTPAMRDLMEFEVKRTEEWFARGEALLPLVNRRVRTDIALYGRGGRAILQSIRDIGYNTLVQRPTLSKWCKVKLLTRYLLGL